MLFRRDVEPSCSYCRHGLNLGQDEFMCIKHGIMAGWGYCGAFRYEPTKREPEFAQSINMREMSEEEFALVV